MKDERSFATWVLDNGMLIILGGLLSPIVIGFLAMPFTGDFNSGAGFASVVFLFGSFLLVFLAAIFEG